ncbi:MAG: C39 family peptidase [Coprobacillus sp.]
MKKLLTGCSIFIGILVIAIIFLNIVQPGTQTTHPQYTSYNYPSSFMIKDENNYFDYQPGYECSAFSSSYLLRHYGASDKGLELYKTFPDKLSNGGGVYPSGIVKMFTSRGYQAEFVTNASIDDLKQELSLGHPVIVYIHVYVVTDTVHCTHYVPIVGYDENYFYFAESLPYMADYKDQDLPYNRKTDIETFKKLWTNVEGYYESPYFSIKK